MPTVWNVLQSAGEPLEGLRVQVFLFRGDVRTPAFVDDQELGLTGPWYATIDDEGRWSLELVANAEISTPENTYYVAHEPQPLYDRPIVTPFRLLADPDEQWLGDVRIADPEAEPLPVTVLPQAAYLVAAPNGELPAAVVALPVLDAGMGVLDGSGAVAVVSPVIEAGSVVLLTWASAGVGQLRAMALVPGVGFLASSTSVGDATRTFFWAVIRP